jgi:enoyl-CoA hydratase/carnithine racemase
MTGSITAYMDEVGRYPLHISDYDKTVLAIRDGEFDAFKNLYPRVSDQTDDLLIEVAGRPGVVGGNMTLILLAAVERFSPEAYLTACKRAVETGDSWRVQTLVKESEIKNFGLSFGTEDFKEGTTAFLEKRKAEFPGK